MCDTNQNNHLLQCLTLPIWAPECQALWEIVMYISGTGGTLLTGWLGWKLIEQRKKREALLREQQELEDAAEAAKLAQQDEVENPAAFTTDVTDPFLAKKIREELMLRRWKNMQSKQ